MLTLGTLEVPEVGIGSGLNMIDRVCRDRQAPKVPVADAGCSRIAGMQALFFTSKGIFRRWRR